MCYTFRVAVLLEVLSVNITERNIRCWLYELRVTL